MVYQLQLWYGDQHLQPRDQKLPSMRILGVEFLSQDWNEIQYVEVSTVCYDVFHQSIE